MKKLLLIFLLLPSLCYAQRTASNPLGGSLIVQDAGTCSTTGSFLWQVLPSNASTTTVNLSGTFSGTVTVRESNNGGGSWSTAGTQSAVGTSSYSTNGFTDICADVTTYTSGTISITISTGLNTGPQGPAGPSGAGGGITVVSVLPATCTVGQQFQLPNNSIVSCGPLANQFFISADGGVAYANPVAFGAKFDGHRVKDASTTAANKTITFATSNDGNFTAADIGKVIFCTGGSTVNGPVVQIGTIASINSAQSIQSSNNSTSTVTGTAICAWGTDDSAGSDPLNSAWNAAANTSASSNADVIYQMPAGITFTHKCLWNASTFPNNGSYNAYVRPTIQAAGAGTTIIIVLPLISQGGTFDLTTCPTGSSAYPGMFGPNAGAGTSYTMRDFTIDGLGNNLSGINIGNLSVLGSGNSTNPVGVVVMDQVQCVGFGANATSNTLYGLKTSGTNSSYKDVFIDACGFAGIVVFQPGNASQQIPEVSFYNVFSGDAGGIALTVNAGVTLNDYAGVYGPGGSGNDGIQIIGGTFNAYGTSNIDQASVDALRCISTAICNLYGAQFDQHLVTGANGCNVDGSSIIRMTDSTCKGNATGNGLNLIAGGVFNDLGGNTLPIPNNILGTLIADGHSVKGICTGVGTAASTLGLYGTGPNVTLTTCTSAAIGTGITISGSRTLQNLKATATAAGTNASSGVVTVLVDGAGSAITCTIGTGTSCIDGTHSVAVTDGQRVSIQFTTQAADTLAGVKAIVGW